MAVIISTVNMKGGVGKTTLTVNLATCLAQHHRKRVLVVDLDSQISATLSLMPPQDFAKVRRSRQTLAYLIDKVVRPNVRRKFSTPDLVCSQVCGISGLELLPGDIELYDEYLVSKMLHEEAIASDGVDFDRTWACFEIELVHTILDSVRNDYDFIIMDCSPGYNLLTRSAIVASDYYLLPARPEPLSLVGIQLLERRIARLKKERGDEHEGIRKLSLLGIVFILSGSGILGRYYKQVMNRIESDFEPHQVFDNRIPMDVNIAKAVDMFTPAVVATPSSAGSRAFIKLAEECLAKLASDR
ncbi:ATPase involved in chromosome partitioning [Rubidibacter lacunae KORDI 51-2]|uniref:ATPase involved in chromosome partitioning n=1 Tax=Rubidibacter lacunae KORDI 51-2 TaxID=582515 RepID=U5DM85_9CHRO|nr:ParA family protein [Rubidibacter lacunae]ERN40825.1 ATPase involved in chromosome partitioning [Rubidibacter lacunae KORDI 51-2]